MPIIDGAGPLLQIAVAMAAPGASRDAPRLATKVIALSAFDLRDDRDVVRLEKRVRSAAYLVCMHDAQGRFVGPSAHDRKVCHAEAMASVRPRIAALVADARDRRSAPERVASGSADPALSAGTTAP